MDKSYAILIWGKYPPEPYEIIKIEGDKITLFDSIENKTFTMDSNLIWILT